MYTDKASLKADREDWAGGGSLKPSQSMGKTNASRTIPTVGPAAPAKENILILTRIHPGLCPKPRRHMPYTALLGRQSTISSRTTCAFLCTVITAPPFCGPCLSHLAWYLGAICFLGWVFGYQTRSRGRPLAMISLARTTDPWLWVNAARLLHYRRPRAMSVVQQSSDQWLEKAARLLGC